MDDKELADKVVALGVGQTNNRGGYYPPTHNGLSYIPKFFVRDWRVAGALMEKCLSVEFITVSRTGERSAVAQAGGPIADAVNTSLPRAIIEACVEALASEADKGEKE